MYKKQEGSGELGERKARWGGGGLGELGMGFGLPCWPATLSALYCLVVIQTSTHSLVPSSCVAQMGHWKATSSLGTVTAPLLHTGKS